MIATGLWRTLILIWLRVPDPFQVYQLVTLFGRFWRLLFSVRESVRVGKERGKNKRRKETLEINVAQYGQMEKKGAIIKKVVYLG